MVTFLSKVFDVYPLGHTPNAQNRRLAGIIHSDEDAGGTRVPKPPYRYWGNLSLVNGHDFILYPIVSKTLSSLLVDWCGDLECETVVLHQHPDWSVPRNVYPHELRNVPWSRASATSSDYVAVKAPVLPLLRRFSRDATGQKYFDIDRELVVPHVFWVARDIPPCLYVSEECKRAIETAGLNVSFLRPARVRRRKTH